VHCAGVPHITCPLAQPHTLALHTRPLEHTVPQPPQLEGSVVVSTQAPLQYVLPGAQPHTPCWQLRPPAQMLPHWPQLALSVNELVHWLPHIS
jgi:hypothetical protein